jgi:hypothetical protein
LPYFLEKKEKTEKKSPDFRQWVRVARLDLGRIQRKLYCPPRTVAI